MKTTRSRFRWFKFALKGLAALLLVVAAAVGITYYRWTRGPLPQLEGEIRLVGLSAPVTVRRDEFGIPHLSAATLEDLAMAQGYVCAQDRLWQMDAMRRAARGELAEIFGAARLKYDQAQRKLGFGPVVEQTYRTLPPEFKQRLAAYAKGVNAYLDTHRNALPVEFRLLQYEPRPWQPTDSLVIGKLMAQSLGTTFPVDLMRDKFAAHLDEATCKRLLPETDPLDQIVYGSDGLEPESAKTATTGYRVSGIGAERGAASGHQPAGIGLEKENSGIEGEKAPVPGPRSPIPEAVAANIPEKEGLAIVGLDGEYLGSNNWVLSGARTTTGKPILCNDPHLGHGIPSIWYQVHVALQDGSFDVAGVTFPGAPGVVIGHNRFIAWGVTNFQPDVQDLFVETFNPQNPAEYRVGEKWVKAEVRTEIIRVRRSMLSTATTEEPLKVTVTRHGPVVREIAGRQYALRWTALDPVTEFETFSMLASARNWDDFQAALKRYPGPMQNFIYADQEGNIGYWGAGNVPVRASGDGSRPVDGAAGRAEWTGYIPFEELPHLFNPPEGIVVTANQRITGLGEKHFYTHEWVSPYRAAAIQRRLRQKEKFSPDEMAEIQQDTWSYPEQVFVEEVLKLAASHAGDATWQEIQTELKDWKGELRPDSRAAAIVFSWHRRFGKNLLEAKLGPELAKEYAWDSRETFYRSLITDRPADWLPQGVPSYDAYLAQTYRETITDLEGQFGKDRNTWQYGRLNTLEFAHPLGLVPGLKQFLNSPVLELGGSAHTVNAFGKGGMWGVSMRMTVDLQNLDNTRQNMTVGISGQPASPHYQDQVSDWHGVKPHLFAFSAKAVEQCTRTTLVLKP